MSNFYVEFAKDLLRDTIEPQERAVLEAQIAKLEADSIFTPSPHRDGQHYEDDSYQLDRQLGMGGMFDRSGMGPGEGW